MPALDAGIFFWWGGEDDRINSGHDEMGGVERVGF
jgi:hypothetical protein